MNRNPLTLWIAPAGIEMNIILGELERQFGFELHLPELKYFSNSRCFSKTPLWIAPAGIEIPLIVEFAKNESKLWIAPAGIEIVQITRGESRITLWIAPAGIEIIFNCLNKIGTLDFELHLPELKLSSAV